MQTLFLLFLLLQPATQPATAPAGEHDVDELTLTPRPVDDASRGVSLWHGSLAPAPGDAVPRYLRAALFARPTDGANAPDEIIYEGEDDPARLAFAVGETVGVFRDLVAQAAAGEATDWGLRPATYETLLPDLNALRLMTNRLVAESRLAATHGLSPRLAGRLDGETRTLRAEGVLHGDQSFGKGVSPGPVDVEVAVLSEQEVLDLVAENARLIGAVGHDVARQGFGVSMHVGRGIERQMLESLWPYVGRPGAVNLGPALEALPLDAGDVLATLAAERATFYNTFPGLATLRGREPTAEEARAIAAAVGGLLGESDRDERIEVATPQQWAAWLRAYERAHREQLVLADTPYVAWDDTDRKYAEAGPLAEFVPTLSGPRRERARTERERLLLLAVERLRAMGALPAEYDAGTDPVTGRPITYERTDGGFTLTIDGTGTSSPTRRVVATFRHAD